MKKAKFKRRNWPAVHHPFDGRGCQKVFLNGVALQKCVYANPKRGVVRVVDTLPDGSPWVSADGKVRTRKLRGRVKVVWA